VSTSSLWSRPDPLTPQNQGNDALKTGLRQKKKFYLRQAIEQYDKGLEQRCADAALNSILCSNRAHVNLLLGNFRNAYQDGLAALRHNDQNIKVRWVGQRRCGAGQRSAPTSKCLTARPPGQDVPACRSCHASLRGAVRITRRCRLTTAPPRAPWACASTSAPQSCARRGCVWSPTARS
jgi:hypothetical protein